MGTYTGRHRERQRVNSDDVFLLGACGNRWPPLPDVQGQPRNGNRYGGEMGAGRNELPATGAAVIIGRGIIYVLNIEHRRVVQADQPMEFKANWRRPKFAN